MLWIRNVIRYRVIHERIRQIILFSKQLQKQDLQDIDYLDANYIPLYPMDENVPFITSVFKIITMPIFGGFDHPHNETGLIQRGNTRKIR